MLLVPLGLDQSQGDQIDNANHFADKGYAKTIDEEQLTAQILLQELNEMEQERTRIINILNRMNKVIRKKLYLIR